MTESTPAIQPIIHNFTNQLIPSITINVVRSLVEMWGFGRLQEACGVDLRKSPREERQTPTFMNVQPQVTFRPKRLMVPSSIAADFLDEDPAPAKPARKPITITPERRKALQLHGRYLGAMRGLSIKNRAKVKSVAKLSGTKAAIKLGSRTKTRAGTQTSQEVGQEVDQKASQKASQEAGQEADQGRQDHNQDRSPAPIREVSTMQLKRTSTRDMGFPKMTLLVALPRSDKPKSYTDTVDPIDSWMSAYNKPSIFFCPPGTYAVLKIAGTTVMSDTPMERLTNQKIVKKATGRVLIAGLGLGMILHPIAAKARVQSITVVEQSRDVIRMIREDRPWQNEDRTRRHLPVERGGIPVRHHLLRHLA